MNGILRGLVQRLQWVMVYDPGKGEINQGPGPARVSEGPCAGRFETRANGNLNF